MVGVNRGCCYDRGVVCEYVFYLFIRSTVMYSLHLKCLNIRLVFRDGLQIGICFILKHELIFLL